MRKIADEKEFGLVDIPAEQMLVQQYEALLSTMSQKINLIKNKKSEEADRLYKVTKNIVSEILKVVDTLKKDESRDESKQQNELIKIVNKFARLVKSNLNSYLQKDIKDMNLTEDKKQEPKEQLGALGLPLTASKKSDIDEILQDYQEQIESVLGKIHNNITSEVHNKNIFFKSDGQNILAVSIGDNFIVNNIIPCGDISITYPSYSLAFYQRYWKPIVEAIEFFYVDDLKTIIDTNKIDIPDVPRRLPFSEVISVLDVAMCDETSIKISFIGDTLESSIWKIEKSECKQITASSKYTEQDYIKNGKPAIVMCVDPVLKTIYNKTGQVIQVIPNETDVELDIDFGNHIIRLEESQIKIVDV